MQLIRLENPLDHVHMESIRLDRENPLDHVYTGEPSPNQEDDLLPEPVPGTLSAEEKACLKDIAAWELTLWARNRDFFPDVTMLPPDLLTRHSSFNWVSPVQ
ncbi:hypothetical protein HYALB_00011245 [Hymenoscyphus albidus]|uniref:Uncharacterized protein n=1 Tax=Hymenoscyphus albidus TaxID=595503 RepID=A0A9N9LWC4_9HELO|nr:hypothetical protein HYALB_00011245 [Hymenoscyphus albidus]